MDKTEFDAMAVWYRELILLPKYATTASLDQALIRQAAAGNSGLDIGHARCIRSREMSCAFADAAGAAITAAP
jgi:hypothetical protein